jgi:hypothetical protein
MKLPRLRPAAWPALLLLSAAAQAHSPYLKPNTFSADAERKHVTVEASFAEGGLRPDVAMKSDAFHLIGPDGRRQPLTPAAVLKDASYLEVPLEAQGTYLVSSGVRKGRVAKAVLRQGQVHFTEGRDEIQPGDTPIEVQSLTRSDVYVSRGRPSAVDYATEGLEIYPVTPPQDVYAGEPVTVRIRENRQPLAGQTLTVIADGQQYTAQKPAEPQYRSDAAGEVRFTPPTAGVYLLQVRVRQPAPGHPSLWLSHSATLTLEVQPQP